MRGIFNLDSPFMQLLGKIADLLILDLLWLVCSLPVITIGASTSALYYVCFKLSKDREGPLFKSFFKAFRDNWKRGTAIWLILLVTGLFLAFDLQALTSLSDGTSAVSVILFCLFVLFAVLWGLMLLYAFPLQAHFDNPVKRTLRNAIGLGVSHLGYSVLMLLMDAALIYLGILYAPVAVPALPVFFNCLLLEKVFAKHQPAEVPATVQ